MTDKEGGHRAAAIYGMHSDNKIYRYHALTATTTGSSEKNKKNSTKTDEHIKPGQVHLYSIAKEEDHKYIESSLHKKPNTAHNTLSGMPCFLPGNNWCVIHPTKS